MKLIHHLLQQNSVRDLLQKLDDDMYREGAERGFDELKTTHDHIARVRVMWEEAEVC